MATVDNIRNGLIDFLVALNKLISSGSSKSEIVELTRAKNNVGNE
ncbi:hypothetical protein [Salegentibacter tibetensis]|nr:hypothetical protein [Salegentibacter tibetensis]